MAKSNYIIMVVPIWMTPEMFMDFAEERGIDKILEQLDITLDFGFNGVDGHHLVYLKGPIVMLMSLGSMLSEAGLEVPFMCHNGVPEA
jgi:hypothetical protein